MKRIALFITAIFICGAAIAQTIRWHIGDTVYQTTTCNSGESITPPTAPDKFGYTFQEWAEYTPIEYLESTGSQGIDTGIYVKQSNFQKIRFILKEEMIQMSGWRLSGSAANGYNALYVGIRNDGRYGYGVGSDEFVSENSSLTRFVIYDLNTKEFYYKVYKADDNSLVSYIPALKIFSNFSAQGLPLYLFGYSGEDRLHSSKVYYSKIYIDDILVRDFIPVLDENGIPCMYDKVEGKYYYNQGSGQFIAGPVVTQ